MSNMERSSRSLKWIAVHDLLIDLMTKSQIITRKTTKRVYRMSMLKLSMQPYSEGKKKKKLPGGGNKSSLAQLSIVSNDASEAPLDWQVGMKSKRGDEESDDDVEWEEASTAGGTSGIPILDDLNVEADEDAKDEIDWKEG